MVRQTSFESLRPPTGENVLRSHVSLKHPCERLDKTDSLPGPRDHGPGRGYGRRRQIADIQKLLGDDGGAEECIGMMPPSIRLGRQNNV